MKKPDKQAELFAAYIQKRKIVIADVSSGARTGLAKSLVDLGAKMNNITLATSYENAVSAINEKKPDVVICDYQLGPRCGLDLLADQRKVRPESKECLFVLVTGNTSQSAVAQAAEED